MADQPDNQPVKVRQGALVKLPERSPYLPVGQKDAQGREGSGFTKLESPEPAYNADQVKADNAAREKQVRDWRGTFQGYYPDMYGNKSPVYLDQRGYYFWGQGQQPFSEQRAYLGDTKGYQPFDQPNADRLRTQLASLRPGNPYQNEKSWSQFNPVTPTVGDLNYGLRVQESWDKDRRPIAGENETRPIQNNIQRVQDEKYMEWYLSHTPVSKQNAVAQAFIGGKGAIDTLLSKGQIIDQDVQDFQKFKDVAQRYADEIKGVQGTGVGADALKGAGPETLVSGKAGLGLALGKAAFEFTDNFAKGKYDSAALRSVLPGHIAQDELDTVRSTENLINGARVNDPQILDWHNAAVEDLAKRGMAASGDDQVTNPIRQPGIVAQEERPDPNAPPQPQPKYRLSGMELPAAKFPQISLPGPKMPVPAPMAEQKISVTPIGQGNEPEPPQQPQENIWQKAGDWFKGIFTPHHPASLQTGNAPTPSPSPSVTPAPIANATPERSPSNYPAAARNRVMSLVTGQSNPNAPPEDQPNVSAVLERKRQLQQQAPAPNPTYVAPPEWGKPPNPPSEGEVGSYEVPTLSQQEHVDALPRGSAFRWHDGYHYIKT